MDRPVNKIIAYFRSSDAYRLPSDLGFICRLAQKIKNSEIEVIIGSMHIYMEEKK